MRVQTVGRVTGGELKQGKNRKWKMENGKKTTIAETQRAPRKRRVKISSDARGNPGRGNGI